MVLGETFVLWSKTLIVQFSYFAVFAVSAIGTSTIFIPFPSYFVIIAFAVGMGLNPLAVGIIAGLGSTIGEITGYLVGLGSEKVIEEKEKKLPKFIKFFINYFKKFGFPIIVITALLPFPFDIVGIMAGMSDYDIKKFFIATLIGKTIKTLIIAYGIYLTIPYLEHLAGAM
jgi:membrane protein YqaA with SNARE-associated domain